MIEKDIKQELATTTSKVYRLYFATGIGTQAAFLYRFKQNLMLCNAYGNLPAER